MSNNKPRPHDVTVDVLRETNNGAVMWGDVRLLHMIADRLGMDMGAPGVGRKMSRVIQAIARDPGPLLEPMWTRAGNRTVRVFRLREEAETKRPGAGKTEQP